MVTETDPKVGNLTTNYIPKWNGTTLTNGTLFDNNSKIGIGTTTPNNKLDINGNAVIGQSYILSNSIAPTNGLAVEGTLNVGAASNITNQNAYKLEVFSSTKNNTL